MKNKILILFLSLSFLSCGKTTQLSGIELEEIRNVSPDFNGIIATTAYDIEINDGDNNGEIVLKGDSALIDKIVVEVRDEKLVISQKRGFYSSHGDAVKISLNSNQLKSILLTGSGNITSNTIQKSDDIKIILDGSGHITTQISASKTELQLNGSGEINISGNTDELNAGITGSGDIHGFNFSAKNVIAGLTGSGNLEINVTESLDAGVVGSGQLKYKGNPTGKNFNVAGSGEIIDVN